jgi:HD-like signal output (HDOD) protein
MTRPLEFEQLVVELIKRDAVRIPPYPAVAMKLRNLVASGSYGTSDLAKLAGGDQALAATLLRYANSAQYRGVTQISSLADAIQRIGANEVCKISLALGVAGQASSAGPLAELRRFAWRQAYMSAVVCHMLASKRGLKGEEGFLSGLLHDFGRLVAVSAFEQIITQRRDIPPRTMAEWEEMVDRFHVELGLVTATRWNLPSVIVAAVSSHHQPELAGVHRAMVDVVIAADAIVSTAEKSPVVTESVLAPVPALNPDEIPLIARLVPQLPALVATLDDVTAAAAEPVIASQVDKPVTLLEGAARALDAAVLVLRSTGNLTFRGQRITRTGVAFTGAGKLKVNNLVRLKVDAGAKGSIEVWANVLLCQQSPEGQVVETKLFGMERAAQVAWDRIYDGGAP